MTTRIILLLTAIAPVYSAERVVRLQGSQNFRDLGGYETEDGRKVKWGRVFRSDALARLTEADYEKLAQLKIRTVCDLRSRMERDREPTKWQGPAPEMISLEMGVSGNPNQDPTATFLQPLLSGQATPAQIAQMMQDSMGQMAAKEGKQAGAVYRRLIATGEPLLFHCTAGKDRTGLTAALLLTMLGVKRAQIMEDYLLVNQLMPPEKVAPAMAKRLEAMVGRPVDPALMVPLMGTRAEWLNAAFAGIESGFGSFDRFRREVMGLTDEDVAVLKLRLLE
jgi:protein-tyrosine phosphatase